MVTRAANATTGPAPVKRMFDYYRRDEHEVASPPALCRWNACWTTESPMPLACPVEFHARSYTMAISFPLSSHPGGGSAAGMRGDTLGAACASNKRKYPPGKPVALLERQVYLVPNARYAFLCRFYALSMRFLCVSYIGFAPTEAVFPA